MMRAAALFAEARSASPQAIKAILAAAGFDDISKNELLVLGALALNGPPPGPPGQPGPAAASPPGNGALETQLASQLGLTAPEVGQIIGALARHGYLEPGISGRGERAIAAVADGIPAARWTDFAFRPGDIVISTLPKSGTTWLQMICALLIFQRPDLPAPMPELSPWMESGSCSREEVYARLAAQRHRRFIKTHLPLQEIPLRPGVTYIVVARHPLDVAVSMYYQDGPFPQPPGEWLVEWFEAEDSPWAHRNSLPGAMRRMRYVWACQEPNVLLMHYQDLSEDLAGQMRGLAARLGIAVDRDAWPGLVQAATFGQMRAAADRLVDGGSDPATFFRAGVSGAGRELLSAAELARYDDRMAGLAPPDLLAWLHRDQGAPYSPDSCPDSGRICG